MRFTTRYESPLGPVLLAADDEGLTGLWFEGQKYFARNLDPGSVETTTSALSAARDWLDEYFAGEEPQTEVPLHPIGTPFQEDVWNILLQIPYGQTTTYGDIAQTIARKRGVEKVSAQAVGGAVGHNQISVIIPCHRVVGASGSLTGYAGGINKKIELLKLEKAWDESFFIPATTTAP